MAVRPVVSAVLTGLTPATLPAAVDEAATLLESALT
jgi:hypothetical protein